ncbi:bax inhibitor 1-like [Cynara cardunculus var. scolymus]|uniref:bax inhibitor 1-like n=1 Tax=Cynara cardunculus var. scolymus TaxID=59895 RepID=UPI000D62C36C|nr:bax inhibitor 1-like [Cynara cardunculus var. scolymus]
MDRIKKYFVRPWNSAAMLSNDPVPRFAWEHLLMMYSTLCYAFVFALFGGFSHVFFNNGGWITAVGFIGTSLWISKIKPWREIPRVILLMVAAYFSGVTLGPLINLFIEMDQRNRLQMWFTVPFHLVWISLLCYFFDYPLSDLVFVYLLVLSLIIHMKMHSQHAIFLAARHNEESYYVSTTIAFFTDFPARTIGFFTHYGTN